MRGIREWWNWKCWLWTGALVWSLAWGFISFPSWTSGFQFGLVPMWLVSINSQWLTYMDKEIKSINDEIIEIQNDTIGAQRDHIRTLEARLTESGWWDR